jgi:hypothetical protein
LQDPVKPGNDTERYATIGHQHAVADRCTVRIDRYTIGMVRGLARAVALALQFDQHAAAGIIDP